MRNAADIVIGRDLSIAYADLSADIEREAADMKLRNMPLTIRKIRQYAAICRRAALAERDDPEPPVRGCGICGGTANCVAA